MNNPDTLDKISRIGKVVFYVSLLVLFISLLPVLFGLRSGELLIGGAGIEPIPDASPSEISQRTWINTIMAYIAAIAGALGMTTSSISSVRKSKLESNVEAMKLKTAQLQYEMQMREIEILKLELKKESREEQETRKTKTRKTEKK